MERGLLAAMATFLAAGVARGAEAGPSDAPIATASHDVEEVYVWGKREGRIGEAASASEGVVSYGAYANRPLLRPGELAEVVPGLAATQHSGSGKANQYFLRGFNLDHGTDFSISLDGAPLNLRTHAHGQGYLDINGVTPEFIERIDYRKGPYFAETGDFSAAGAAAFRTFAQAPGGGFVQAQAGEHDYVRAVAAVNVGGGLLGVDLTASDGPWTRREGLRKASILGRLPLGDWSLTALAYGARWNSTDQVPERAIDDGRLSRLGAVDTSDGGRTRRFILTARRHPDDASDTVLYVQRYTLNLWSDFTYFLDDPVNGDQFEQAERRWIVGGSSARTVRVGDWTLRGGVETRLDDIGRIGLYRTRARARLSTDREDGVREWSGAAWGSVGWEAGPLRANLGLRADAIHVSVSSDDPRNSGRRTDALLSPKLTLAWRASDAVEIYADAGRGYHSNDARGAVERVIPGTETPAVRAPLFAAADGGEVGARFERGGLTASVSAWALRLQSELVYSGDAGDTESTGATQRLGAEVLVAWTPRPGINLDLSAAATRARYRGDPADGNRIPNALDYVVTVGATVRLTPRSLAQVTLRRLGPAPLIEDNSARSRPATVVNAAYSYRLGRVSLTADVLNLLDSHDQDITYFYASRLPGEPADGIEDFHVHPMEPRQVRLGVRYDF